jgi:hypothetical protein
MFHCHILEHEDMGMMGQFVVDSLDDEVRLEGPVAQALGCESAPHVDRHAVSTPIGALTHLFE